MAGSSSLIGQTISHYRIVAKIGAGAMGEVYRATDSTLGRDLALKILPPDMARDPIRLARFQREARAVASLNHPHIVTIFSVEEEHGVHFFTMELVEGQSLDRRIPEGGLAVEQIVEIATALADALAAVHEKGIVHRDLKSANVMVTDEGRVKVLDFGLAKDVREAEPSDATLTSAAQTQVGVVMGTPAYMSPEQISGRAVDHRTDIFSLGVMLHEMATGRRPFQGDSSAELISSILRDTPSLVTDVRVDLPGDLARIIRSCLEKDPQHRVQTARDVAKDFRDMGRQASPKAAAPTSRAVTAADSGLVRAGQGFWVAVLPFKCSGNAELTALAEGLTEDIVTGLLRFSYLRVLTRRSTMGSTSEAEEARSVGKDLGARYVMEGSLRQSGSRLRIAVQLVDTNSGAHLWAETYDRSFQSEAVFELQDEIVPLIVSTVADWYGVLPRSMSEALRSKGPDQLSPYEAVLRSIGYYERLSADEHATARACLERAVEQAPGHADCWAMLSMIYSEEYKFGFNAQPNSLERAVRAARRATEIAPSNALANCALATALFFRREFEAFRIAAERPIALNPMDGFAIAYMGMMMSFAGDWERGSALAERALTLNPRHPGWYWFSAYYNAYRKCDYRGALSVALKINMPGFHTTHHVIAAAYAQLGDLEAAGKALVELLAVSPHFAKFAREEFGKWLQPELVEHVLDGLRKAGMEFPSQNGTPPVKVTAETGT